MTTAWKFSIDFAAVPEFNEEEIRAMVTRTANQADGRVIVKGNDIYLTKLDDAFAFRMRAGEFVEGGEKTRVRA